MTIERAAELAANPNALIEPQAQAALPPGILDALQEAMATSIHKVFWVGTVLSAMALLVCFFLPRLESKEEDRETESREVEPLTS
jgi:hypothetical protein